MCVGTFSQESKFYCNTHIRVGNKPIFFFPSLKTTAFSQEDKIPEFFVLIQHQAKSKNEAF